MLQGAAKDHKIDFALLEKHPTGTTGIGGRQDTYVMDDTKFIFEDDQASEPIVLHADMQVLRPDPEIKDPFSFALFGTDLLSRFRFEYDMPRASLDLVRPEG